jgi:hypothetical protein
MIDRGGTMMKRSMTTKRCIMNVSLAAGLVVGAASAAPATFPQKAVRRCGPDAVVAGTVCLDTHEASVWRVRNATTTNAFLRRERPRRRTDMDSS